MIQRVIVAGWFVFFIFLAFYFCTEFLHLTRAHREINYLHNGLLMLELKKKIKLFKKMFLTPVSILSALEF